MTTAALIVGAGRGRRFGGDLPKQYHRLDGEPVIRRTVRAFLEHPKIDIIQSVIHADDKDLFGDSVDGMDVAPPVSGGATRQQSVLNGLEAIADMAPDRVLIHDAARPFIDGPLIDRVVDGLSDHAGVVPAIAVTDTLKRVDNGRVVTTVDRAGLWRVQTPQGFRFPDILAAHRRAVGLDLTDDAAVAEHAGLGVAVVDGGESNTKITVTEDLKMARSAAAWIYRTGQGFDVHKFGAGDHVHLCGIRIDHHRGLVGHSDADVALHALTDAVLGAAGAGDIGEHFPPSDPRWRGEPSSTFLRRAREIVAERSGEIVNVDVTIICEQPKVGPYRDAMRDKVATLLEIDASAVNIKATTTEKLGFTGRREGIAAQATASIRLPDV